MLGLPGGPRGRAAGRERGAAAATVRGARQGAQQARHAEVVSLTWEFAWSPSPPNKHNFVVNLAIYSILLGSTYFRIQISTTIIQSGAQNFRREHFDHPLNFSPAVENPPKKYKSKTDQGRF